MARPVETTTVLQLPARLSELRRVHSWLQQKLGSRELSTDQTFAIELCLEEAITNVVTHAAKERDDVTVEVRLEFVDGMVVMTVTDNGRPFDPLSVESMPAAATLEQAEIGGRGLQLIRAFAEQLRYDRRGCCNCFTMIARLGPEGGVQSVY